MSPAGGGRRLLVRDLAQLATPRGTTAPLRGRALGDVDILPRFLDAASRYQGRPSEAEIDALFERLQPQPIFV